MFKFFKKKRPDPKDAETLHREARALGQSGKYDAAIEKLQAAIAIKPEWAYPYYDLAFTYFLKGNAAKEILLQMLKDPETTRSNLALAKFTLENIGGSVPPSM